MPDFSGHHSVVGRLP